MNKIFFFFSFYLLYNINCDSNLYQLNQIKLLINGFQNFTETFESKKPSSPLNANISVDFDMLIVPKEKWFNVMSYDSSLFQFKSTIIGNLYYHNESIYSTNHDGLHYIINNQFGDFYFYEFFYFSEFTDEKDLYLLFVHSYGIVFESENKDFINYYIFNDLKNKIENKKIEPKINIKLNFKYNLNDFDDNNIKNAY